MKFGQVKQNLPVDTRVIIGAVPAGDALENATGVILGTYFTDPVVDHYIVLLDKPIEGKKAIGITESCLCPIEPVEDNSLRRYGVFGWSGWAEGGMGDLIRSFDDLGEARDFYHDIMTFDGHIFDFEERKYVL